MSFLDLFSGSGLVGIEAASRNAQKVVLVEKDRKKKKIILENISFVETDIRLFLYPADRYIKTCKSKYDIIYLDPPFNMSGKMSYISIIYEKKVLDENGTLIIHIPGEDPYTEEIGNLCISDIRKYGRSLLLFYKR